MGSDQLRHGPSAPLCSVCKKDRQARRESERKIGVSGQLLHRAFYSFLSNFRKADAALKRPLRCPCYFNGFRSHPVFSHDFGTCIAQNPVKTIRMRWGGRDNLEMMLWVDPELSLLFQWFSVTPCVRNHIKTQTGCIFYATNTPLPVFSHDFGTCMAQNLVKTIRARCGGTGTI